MRQLEALDGARGTHRRRPVRELAGLRADLSLAAVDAILVAASYVLALGVRMLDSVATPAVWWANMPSSLPAIVAVHLLANVVFGAYGHVWEHASIIEARRVALAALSSGLVLIGGTLALGIRPVPLSVLLAGSLMSFICLGVARFRSRLLEFGELLGRADHQRAVVLGTDRRAVDVARHLQKTVDGLDVFGFISPVAPIESRLLGGLPVLGSVDDLPRIAQELDVTQVVVGGHDGDELVRRLVGRRVGADISLRIVPALGDVLDSAPTTHGSLDMSELLGRPKVSTDLEAIDRMIRGRRVAVTGAGGFIGSRMIARVLDFAPEAVIAMDHDGTHLHEAAARWDAHTGSRVIHALCDIRDLPQVERLMLRHRPDVVFHAAAHKHVPILEAWPEEAIKANVIGTSNILAAARSARTERFILFSTLKAAVPTGVMGASKRIAEMLVQSAGAALPDGFGYASVRLGNVLGSTGSVVPTFLAQIRSGGPVTVAHEEMSRYFLTTEEVVDLTLQSAVLATRGEVFVLDMGEPVRIFDLAQRLIRTAGIASNTGIEVQFTGLRPGDRLDEELARGSVSQSSHPKIWVADAPWPGEGGLGDVMTEFGRLLAEGETDEIRDRLLQLAAGESAAQRQAATRTVTGVE